MYIDHIDWNISSFLENVILLKQGNWRDIETMDDEHQSDYLIQRLEEMFAKMEKRSQKTDAWEGEDEEGEEERGEEKRRRKPQRQAKEKFSPNVSETAKAGGLGDAGKNVEMIQQKERNRFSFRN